MPMTMVILAAAVRYCLLVISVDWVAVTIVVAHYTLSIDRATTAGATTDVGVAMIGAARPRLCALR